MRPQDIAVLLKIVASKSTIPQIVELANGLLLSNSEISESLNRSKTAKLIDYNKKKVNLQNLLEFLEHGINYVFPTEPGAVVRGIPTAHSHPYMKHLFGGETNYVWPSNSGDVIGEQIDPLYAKQVDAIKHDVRLYQMLALVDVLRVGKSREKQVAIKQLKHLILDEPD